MQTTFLCFFPATDTVIVTFVFFGKGEDSFTVIFPDLFFVADMVSFLHFFFLLSRIFLLIERVILDLLGARIVRLRLFFFIETLI